MSFFDKPSVAHNAFRRTALRVAGAVRLLREAGEQITQDRYDSWVAEVVCSGEKLFDATVRENITDPNQNPHRLVTKVSEDTITELSAAWSGVWKCLGGAEHDEDGCYVDPLPGVEFFSIEDYAKRRFDVLAENLEVELLETRQAESPQASPLQRPMFPKRAAWLNERLRERGWNKHDISRQGGPDHKTVQKILDGERVREDVLEKIAQALSNKLGKVTTLDIAID
jgi:hypothetical protein